MWYRKNVGGWERAARLIGGGLMLICGVVALHASCLLYTSDAADE